MFLRHPEKQYLSLIRKIIQNGNIENGRNGKTYVSIGEMMRFSLAVLFLLYGTSLSAQQTPATTSQDAELEKRFAKFTESLKMSALVGNFMVDGDEHQSRKPERYEISKVVKQPRGDYWNFFARIKYGDHDVTLPIPVEVKWAGGTPVITVANLTIPGMGTFDARVLLYDNKYAGTWRHGEFGGLMFGDFSKPGMQPFFQLLKRQIRS